MKRFDKSGRDVTDLPGLWDESDCEIAQTNYPHPTITTGQHTNGPASIWIRPIGGEWINTEKRTRQMVVEGWLAFGIKLFTCEHANQNDSEDFCYDCRAIYDDRIKQWQ